MARQVAQAQGLLFALLAAATFGTSGSFASSLLDAGWSSGAAVTARVGVAAAVLTPAALRQLRGRWHLLGAQRNVVLAYGLIAVAACQVCYFNAVGRLSVGVALLLEYLGIVLIVLWLWVRHGQRPRPLTIAGSTLAVGGLFLVLDVLGGAQIDLIGVLWGLGAAVGLALFFVLSSRSDDALPPLTMAWAGLAVGAVALGIFGALGATPMHATTSDVRFAGHRTSWLVPVLGLSLLAAVVAYVAGIAAARRLGAKLASFVGLTEVLFAIVFAWLLLGQLPKPVQLLGGILVLGGVALVRTDELRQPVHEAAEPLSYAGG
jgi:drug/metabolite transporter (DMT)-like permease